MMLMWRRPIVPPLKKQMILTLKLLSLKVLFFKLSPVIPNAGREKHAWQELMPSLIYPLMTALHAVTENVTDGVVEVETFRCLSGCHIQRNTVNIVSFGGL